MSDAQTLLNRLNKCTTTKEVIILAIITDNSLLEGYISTSEVISSWVGEEPTKRETVIASIFKDFLAHNPS